jgi:hypothetical protein
VLELIDKHIVQAYLDHLGITAHHRGTDKRRRKSDQ